jgi:hypothetical protein
MALRVVGAGLGRTGTTSLKQALELLLNGRCYHMLDLFQHEDDIAVWHAAVSGEPVDWQDLLHDYEATTDWPACTFWRELSAANPHAFVLLSVRESPEKWWASMERTIVPVSKRPIPSDGSVLARQLAMMHDLISGRFTPEFDNPTAAIAAYERHNEDVRSSIASEQLIEWCPGDGWEPICAALGLPVPDQPFPHENKSADYNPDQSVTDESAQAGAQR